MADCSRIQPSEPFAGFFRRLVICFESAFPHDVQVMLGKLPLPRMRQQLSDPKKLWLQLCITRNHQHNVVRRQRRCKRNCTGLAVTKYASPPLCECQFRAALGTRKKNNLLYYHCPCCGDDCDPGERKLRKLLDHARTRHNFVSGCQHDFQLFQASGSLCSDMPRIQLSYDGPRDVLPDCEVSQHKTDSLLRELVPAWESQWESDNMDKNIRRYVIRLTSNLIKMKPKTVESVKSKSDSDSY